MLPRLVSTFRNLTYLPKVTQGGFRYGHAPILAAATASAAAAVTVCCASAESSAPPGNGCNHFDKPGMGCGPPLPLQPEYLRPYEGQWLLMHRAAGSMDDFFDLFQVHPLLRWVAEQVAGYAVEVDADRALIKFHIMSPVPFLKLTETYRLDGGEGTNWRRDLRRGGQHGHVELSQGCLKIKFWWGYPFPGMAVDELRLTSNDTMVLTCRAEVVGQDDIVSGATASDHCGTASFRSVYRRSTPPKP